MWCQGVGEEGSGGGVWLRSSVCYKFLKLGWDKVMVVVELWMQGGYI